MEQNKGNAGNDDGQPNSPSPVPPTQIEPGMVVETTEGDVGENDLSKPRVAEVVQAADGQVEKLVVKKGVIFQKEIEVSPERIQQVQTPRSEEGENENKAASQGKVVIAASAEEIAALSPASTTPDQLPTTTAPLPQLSPAKLPHKNQKDQNQPKKQIGTNLLEQVEQALPTDEGLRQLELERHNHNGLEEVSSPKRGEGPGVGEAAEKKHTPGEDEASASTGSATAGGKGQDQGGLLKVLGPGFLAGMAGNDSSAVTAYSVDGTTAGYGHLWLLLISTPLYYCVQYTCAKLGRLSQKGFAELLKEHYGSWLAWLASLVLIVANVALIAADLVAIGSALELVTGLNWVWFVGPVALLLWYITVYQNFEAIKKIFVAMSLAFVTYLITALFSKPDWGQVLSNTFIPRLDFSFDSISSAVALLGATISPYTLFWQIQGEKEEKRPGPLPHQLKIVRLDIGSGVLSGNLVAYAIILCSAATLFSHHQKIQTAADAARALEPLVGGVAKYLFAFGLVGAGLIAIPVLLASTSYAVAGTIGWPAGLSKKPWQSEGFYLILTGALVVGVIAAVVASNPVGLMFWANVLNGVLAPLLVIFVVLLAFNRSVLPASQRLNRWTILGLVLTTLIMLGAAGLLLWGLLSGQG